MMSAIAHHPMIPSAFTNVHGAAVVRSSITQAMQRILRHEESLSQSQMRSFLLWAYGWQHGLTRSAHDAETVAGLLPDGSAKHACLQAAALARGTLTVSSPPNDMNCELERLLLQQIQTIVAQQIAHSLPAFLQVFPPVYTVEERDRETNVVIPVDDAFLLIPVESIAQVVWRRERA